jgi:hypothetical protein
MAVVDVTAQRIVARHEAIQRLARPGKGSQIVRFHMAEDIVEDLGRELY